MIRSQPLVEPARALAQDLAVVDLPDLDRAAAGGHPRAGDAALARGYPRRGRASSVRNVCHSPASDRRRSAIRQSSGRGAAPRARRGRRPAWRPARPSSRTLVREDRQRRRRRRPRRRSALSATRSSDGLNGGMGRRIRARRRGPRLCTRVRSPPAGPSRRARATSAGLVRCHSPRTTHPHWRLGTCRSAGGIHAYDILRRRPAMQGLGAFSAVA